MKTRLRLLAIIAWAALAGFGKLSAATHYVSLDSPNPRLPYASWATAATNIQEAVDVAKSGDTVLVTNGLYAVGGRDILVLDTNQQPPQLVSIGLSRVVVTNAITLLSVNGPLLTTIEGVQLLDEDGYTTNGVRCVFLGTNAGCTGFTLTNGWTAANCSGGGVWCASKNTFLTNCVIRGDNALGGGGGAYGGTLDKCALTGNSAWWGGGADSCTLHNCSLTGNDAGSGGGASGSTLDNCILTGNSAGDGGGASGCMLNDCTLEYNAASNDGGGASDCTLYNCALSGNYAWSPSHTPNHGGGATTSILYNCMLTGNSAAKGGSGAYGSTLHNCGLTGNYGDGADSCTLYNCTLTDNSGGGVSGSLLYNCITFFNAGSVGGNYDYYSILNYCCTTPLPTNGVGNICADPQLASSSHISANSPCRGAGAFAYTTGMDIDGDPWANPPSIGCDEYQGGSVTGPLTVGLLASYTNVAVGYSVTFTALIEGRTSESVWDFGDGKVAINKPYVTHAWTGPGDYLVAIWAFNKSHREGVGATVIIHVEQGIHYVSASNVNPQPPYTSWATAATNIQEAVDVAQPGGLVLVSNGVYVGGVSLDKPLGLRGVNGPQFTVINGSGGNPCVSLGANASLSFFTLTNGSGGVVCDASGVVSNCVITGNSGSGASGGTLYNCTLSRNSADLGGGASGSTLYNCMLCDNSAWAGGGAFGGTLYNCTLAGNRTTDTNWFNTGGGADFSTLYNCIAYYNTANVGANHFGCTLNYCCTPADPGGIGNITYEPLFVDYSHGNLRLQSNSPCINGGNNAYVTTGTDLGSNLRIVGGTVDIGAHEFQTPASVISYAWLQQYGLPTDGSADFTDPDLDGMNNWQEWRSGTSPTNPLSALRLASATPAGTNVTVTWQSVAGVNYFVQRSTNLALPFTLLATSITGQDRTTSFADTNAVAAGPFFYRVGVSSQ